MIVLTLEPGEAEKLAEGAPGLQRRYGMPIDPAPYARPASSEPACRAVVAARLHAPAAEEPLLRRLRVRVDARRAARRPGADRGGGARRRPRPGGARRVVRSRRRRSRAAGRHRSRAHPVSCRPRPRPQARRPARRSGATPRRATRSSEPTAPWRRRGSRLQPRRGVRDGDREPRPRARPPAEAGARRGCAGLGGRAARDSRGRAHRATRRDRDAGGTEPGRDARRRQVPTSTGRLAASPDA